MANKNYRTAAEKVEKVAQNMQGHNVAGELHKIAQLLLAQSEGVRTAQADPSGFDPSSMYNIQQMSGGDSAPADASPDAGPGGGDPAAAAPGGGSDSGGLNSNIDSFVKMKEGPMMSDTNQHTCSVTFEAPQNVKEHDMMNFILGIEEALGVKVIKFSWSVAPPKPQKV